ncbi:Capsule polysaccharide biosynthesis protein [Marivirga sericea]|uniref:Capsule polysaccharide biosynthesis protein n=1 Tax=Marivirga sericea TaxID=1028 RepID=A0A1X7J753_9BACT|nr:hypothetical protein [Marivirga sericea]SMG23456.1 Capsule polysaccharide biosynthesis protein [Marivirga sericea]
MKILLFSIYPETPHFETELELLQLYSDRGSDLNIAFCDKSIETCLFNPNHNNLLCNICISKRKEGLKLIGGSEPNIIPIAPINSKNSINYKFSSIEELKSITENNINIGKGVASSVISRYREPKINLGTRKDEINKELNNTKHLLNECKRIIEATLPDLIIIFNGRFASYHPIVEYCKTTQLDFLIHERGGNFGTYMARINETPHSRSQAELEIEQLWQKDPIESKRRGELFFKERRDKVIQSWFVHSEKQEKGKIPDAYNPNKKLVCIFNSSRDEFESVDGWLETLYNSEYDAIDKIATSMKGKDDYQLFLRVHPNLSNLENSQIESINNLRQKHTHLNIIPAEDNIDSYSLLDICYKVIVFNSTIGLEATFWNKPTIVIGRALYENLDCSYNPDSHSQVIELIEKDLAPKPKLNAIKVGNWQREFGEEFKYTKQIGVDRAFFKGKKVVPKLPWRILSKIYFSLKKLRN